MSATPSEAPSSVSPAVTREEEEEFQTETVVGSINLAEEIFRNNKSETEAWKSLLKYKKELAAEAQCMSDSKKISGVLFELGQELEDRQGNPEGRFLR